MPVIRVDDTNKDWLEDQRQPLNDTKTESINDVITRWRKSRGKD